MTFFDAHYGLGAYDAPCADGCPACVDDPGHEYMEAFDRREVERKRDHAAQREREEAAVKERNKVRAEERKVERRRRGTR